MIRYQEHKRLDNRDDSSLEYRKNSKKSVQGPTMDKGQALKSGTKRI